MVQNPKYWKAKNGTSKDSSKDSTGNCKQKITFFSSYLYFVLEFGTLFCVPVWRILYHVTFSCKGPIFIVSKDFASVWFRPFTYWQVVVKVISGVSINLSHITANITAFVNSGEPSRSNYNLK